MEKKPLFIYIDVDDTLVRKTESGEEPIPEVVRHVEYLFKNGSILYCWSTGGEDHARSRAQRLGIEHCFKGFLHKPQMFIDDEEPSNWKNFLHIYPNKLGAIEDYRKSVKSDGE